jgi:hypothetical protein
MSGHHSNSLTSGLSLVMLLFLLVVLPGCGSGGGSDGDGNGNGGGWAVAMMNKVPRDASMFTFTDVAAMRADDDLDELYDDYKKKSESECIALGISSDDVDRMEEGYSGYAFTILEGQFALDDVGRVLEDEGYQEGEYKKVKTWKNSSADIEAVALVSATCIVIGDDIDKLEDSIDVIKGDDDSLSDDEDMSDFMGRLPAGVVVSVHTYETYAGCEVTGYSVKKKDSSTVLVTMLLLFDDEDSANDAMEDTKDEYSNSEVTKDGRYITVVAESDIE